MRQNVLRAFLDMVPPAIISKPTGSRLTLWVKPDYIVEGPLAYMTTFRTLCLAHIGRLKYVRRELQQAACSFTAKKLNAAP